MLSSSRSVKLVILFAPPSAGKCFTNASKSRPSSCRICWSDYSLGDFYRVWDDVDNYATAYSVKSPTMNLTDVYDRKKTDFDAFVKHFPAEGGANGLAIFTDRELLNIDLFNRTDIYGEYYPRILRSAAMEVTVLKDKKNEITEAEAKYKTMDLFDNLEKMDYTMHPGAGAGTERRYESDKLTGFDLSYKDHLIHLALLNL